MIKDPAHYDLHGSSRSQIPDTISNVTTQKVRKALQARRTFFIQYPMHSEVNSVFRVHFL